MSAFIRPEVHPPIGRRPMLGLALGLCAAAWLPGVRAQGAYPSRAVRVIIPGGAGSGPDTLTRILTSKLAEMWGQPVVADNVVGAGGNIGHERVAKSVPPDGYTLLLGMIGSFPLSFALKFKAGKLKPLAVTNGRRFEAVPDVPTLAESGLSGFDLAPWNALVAPRGTPGDIVRFLNAHVVAVLAEPELRKRLVELGIQPQSGTPEQLDAFIQAEAKKWGELVRQAKITAE